MNLQDLDFRVWDNDDKKYLNFSCAVDNSISWDNFNICQDFIQTILKSGEIELWTGFKDKDGVKIFINDIVGFCVKENIETNDFEYIECQVCGDVGKLYLVVMDSQDCIDFYEGLECSRNIPFYKVLGNIHEERQGVSNACG